MINIRVGINIKFRINTDEDISFEKIDEGKFKEMSLLPTMMGQKECTTLIAATS